MLKTPLDVSHLLTTINKSHNSHQFLPNICRVSVYVCTYVTIRGGQDKIFMHQRTVLRFPLIEHKLLSNRKFCVKAVTKILLHAKMRTCVNIKSNLFSFWLNLFVSFSFLTDTNTHKHTNCSRFVLVSLSTT